MPDDFVLAIDVGNSRVKAGLFAAAIHGGLPAFVAGTAAPVGEPQPAAAIGRWLAGRGGPRVVLVGGVNPPVIGAICAGWRDEWGPLEVVGRPSAAVLANRTERPDRVGADRLFDAVAANRLRPAGVPAVVVDSGTATTVDLIDGEGAFRGGAIVAGFELVAAALHERTALLPRVEIADSASPPALGTNTEGALRSGLYWGLVGGVKEIIARLSQGAGAGGREPLIVLTGGAGPLLAPHLPAARVEPHLTLQGLVLSAAGGEG